MLFFILAVIAFVIADILIRAVSRQVQEKKRRREREEALAVSLRLDFSREAKTLRRAEVTNPKARILCVDDEEVVLGSFRKILVLDGYAVDTVETGPEALGLLQSHHYDFVFTDLKMPVMDGVEVTKAVKHMRPDIDVVIITGYATVETAVECMKHGAMDYVQKPFTEDELIAFVRKSLLKRQDRIQKQLKPRVHIEHYTAGAHAGAGEFAIPGGVFIAAGHTWASVSENGSVRVGIDDFAKKLLGRVDGVELPNLGMAVKRGQPLFTVKQGGRRVTFASPLSGRVTGVNSYLAGSKDAFEPSPYEGNWVCLLDGEDLDRELPQLKIGNAAVAFYQDEIERLRREITRMSRREQDGSRTPLTGELYLGELADLDQTDWESVVGTFFKR